MGGQFLRNALIYRDGVSAGIRVGAEPDGTTCSLSESIQSLVELPQSELDRATVVVVFGDVNLNDLPPFLGRLRSTEELAFTSRRVEGDPQLTDDNEIFNLSFRNTVYADLSDFAPMPDLLDLRTSVATIEEGEFVLPSDLGSTWPRLRAVQDTSQKIQNLPVLDTAASPVILVAWYGHPQLDELSGPLARLHILPETVEQYSAAVERLREQGTAIIMGE